MLSSTLAALTDDDISGAALVIVRGGETEVPAGVAILRERLKGDDTVKIVPMYRDTDILILTKDILNQAGWHYGTQ